MATYDNRASELKAFDETKLGVKGLVDAGITKIPKFFIQPPEEHELSSLPVEIPIIDLAKLDSDTALRSKVVRKVKIASETIGFFQVVNHGIPLEVLDEMLKGIKKFHEEEPEVKKNYYTREAGKKVVFNCNFELYQGIAASWRDTILMNVAPEPPEPDELPVACRFITLQFATYINKLGITLFELLSEALGLEPNHLIELECNNGLAVVGHYYPPCPEPHLAIGAPKHTDPGFITLLLQDDIAGFQILHENRWVDVPPPPHGTITVNISDLIQLISNDKFKSSEHRVLAHSSTTGPRISIACSFVPRAYPSCNRLYGPLKELTTETNPPLYKETTARDFISHYHRKGFNGQRSLDYLRLSAQS